MIDMIDKIKEVWSEWSEFVYSVLFLGGLFYTLYWALWIFCPC